MIAEINESGRISVKTETDQESDLLKSWLTDNVLLSESFTACCNNRKCAFKFDLKPQMVEQMCIICNENFSATALLEICPKCYGNDYE